MSNNIINKDCLVKIQKVDLFDQSQRILDPGLSYKEALVREIAGDVNHLFQVLKGAGYVSGQRADFDIDVSAHGIELQKLQLIHNTLQPDSELRKIDTEDKPELRHIQTSILNKANACWERFCTASKPLAGAPMANGRNVEPLPPDYAPNKRQRPTAEVELPAAKPKSKAPLKQHRPLRGRRPFFDGRHIKHRHNELRQAAKPGSAPAAPFNFDQTELRLAEENNANLQDRVNKLSAANEQLGRAERELEASETRYAEIASFLQNKTNQCAELRSENSDLRTERDFVVSENAALESERKSIFEELQNTLEQLGESTKHHNTELAARDTQIHDFRAEQRRRTAAATADPFLNLHQGHQRLIKEKGAEIERLKQEQVEEQQLRAREQQQILEKIYNNFDELIEEYHLQDCKDPVDLLERLLLMNRLRSEQYTSKALESVTKITEQNRRLRKEMDDMAARADKGKNPIGRALSSPTVSRFSSN